MAIDSQGFVYVTDKNNHRVQKFTPDGQFISAFGHERLNRPSGITVDDDDLLYVNNEGSDYIFVYTTSGRYVYQFNKGYINDDRIAGRFHGISYRNGTILCCCTFAFRIKIFSV